MTKQSSLRVRHATSQLKKASGVVLGFGILGILWVDIRLIRIMETGNYYIVYWGSIGTMENRMETTMSLVPRLEQSSLQILRFRV